MIVARRAAPIVTLEETGAVEERSLRLNKYILSNLSRLLV